jgi:hypothetical protein
MDTRSKILTFDAALRLPRGEITLVSGYFDALRAAHTRELAKLPRPLLAVVLPRSGELLSQAGRAEMAAALRVIDYVVIAENKELDALVETLTPRQVVRMEARDAALVEQLIEHVHRRQTR